MKNKFWTVRRTVVVETEVEAENGELAYENALTNFASSLSNCLKETYSKKRISKKEYKRRTN